MLSSFASALTALKERATEATIKRLINQKIVAFGSVTNLQFDSRQRTISAQLALIGEHQPIDIKIGSYDVIQDKGQAYISFQRFHASKEWIANGLNEYVAGRRFKLPDAAKMVL